jgi:hypothetical protein
MPQFLHTIWAAVGGDAAHLSAVTSHQAGALPSVFVVTDLAAASIAAASLAVAELVSLRRGYLPAVRVDRRLSSFWFGTSLRPQGWALPPAWDEIAGDYQTADGWIRLHTNMAHHRNAALSVLKALANKTAIAQAVAQWSGDALESAIVQHGGCAAVMRTQAEWAQHPQGQAVAAEPLLHLTPTTAGPKLAWTSPLDRPLQGIRVLDLTRILAGPVATRFLAGFGADVLRIDPPLWDEPRTVPEVTLGKRRARLDLRMVADRQVLVDLLKTADVLVHGLRPDALARLGLDAEMRRMINPRLVDVCLDAYGWSGPWQARRGFDSLLQMSCGIADAGMQRLNRNQPTPLPVQALDHATGYIMAAAAIRGLVRRIESGAGSEIRASLARTAHLLMSCDDPQAETTPFSAETADDYCDALEATDWGVGRRLRSPVEIETIPMQWSHPAGKLGTARAVWAGA